MSSTEEIINKWLDSAKKDLFKNYIKLGLKASGEWGESLEEFKEVSQTKINIGIKANSYTQFIENGRNRNKDQSKEGIRKWVGWAGNTFIAQWVKDKNIVASPFAIAYKIATKGWNVPNRFNAGGLVSDVITKARVEELNKSLSLFYIDNFRSDVIKELK